MIELYKIDTTGLQTKIGTSININFNKFPCEFLRGN